MEMTIRAHDQSTGMIHPTEAPFSFPPVTEALTNAGWMPAPWLFAHAPWRDAASTQVLAKHSAIKGFVRSHLLRACCGTATGAWYGNRSHRRFSQGACVGLCARYGPANRQSDIIDRLHDLRAFASLRCASAIAPFFAGTKLPSTNACDQSTSPAVSRRLSRVRQIRAHVPARDRSRNRRQQALDEPYAFGRSAQAQPVLSTESILFTVRRSLFRGRPRRWRFEMRGSMTAHCASVRSWLLIARAPRIIVTRCIDPD